MFIFVILSEAKDLQAAYLHEILRFAQDDSVLFLPHIVIPAKAGTHRDYPQSFLADNSNGNIPWVPAFAGMTVVRGRDGK